MKKYTLFALLMLFCGMVWCQKEEESVLSQEDLQQLFVMNDSVIREGSKLYLYEKLSWLATDNFFTTGANARGSFIIEDDSMYRVLFVNADLQCVYEENLDKNTYKTQRNTEVRKLNENEMALWERHLRLMGKIGDANIPAYSFPEGTASFNVEIIRVNEKLTRAYVIMGALVDNLIPFGNDFSFDFDNNDSLVAQRAYHHSYIPITWEEGSTPKRVMHSHTRDNPYITPTDICTFLLYGHDQYGLKDLWVYSPALHSYLVFNADMMSIITSTHATIDTGEASPAKNKKSKKAKKK